MPLLEKLIEDHGSVRCLVELTDLHGIEPRALWDEIKFDVHHARQIERCAVVGDRRWEAWMPGCRGRSSSEPRFASSIELELGLTEDEVVKTGTFSDAADRRGQFQQWT